jgi:hypothetical protein
VLERIEYEEVWMMRLSPGHSTHDEVGSELTGS